MNRCVMLVLLIAALLFAVVPGVICAGEAVSIAKTSVVPTPTPSPGLSTDGSKIFWSPNSTSTEPVVLAQFSDTGELEIVVPLREDAMAYARARAAITWIGENKDMIEVDLQNARLNARAESLSVSPVYYSQRLQALLSSTGFPDSTTSIQAQSDGYVDIAQTYDEKGNVPASKWCQRIPVCTGCKWFRCPMGPSGAPVCTCTLYGNNCCVIDAIEGGHGDGQNQEYEDLN